MERRKRRWWTRGITWLSVLLVLAATLSGLFQLAVLAAPGYRSELAAQLSARAGRPVQLDEVELAWRWLLPQLQLRGVQLAADDPRSPAPSAERLRLGFAAGDLLRGRLIPARIDLEGLRLDLDLDLHGRPSLRGFERREPPLELRSLLRQLRGFERLRAERLRLRIHDPRVHDGPYELLIESADLRLVRGAAEGLELRLRARAADWLAESLELRIGMTGPFDAPERWQGRWTVDASGLAVGEPLRARLPVAPALTLEEASLAASGDWQAGRIGTAALTVKAGQLRLATTPALRWRGLEARLDYSPQPGGGRISWSRLALDGVRGPWPARSGGQIAWRRGPQGLRLDGDAEFLRLDDLAPWLALVPVRERPLPAAARSARGDLRGLKGRYESDGSSSPRYALSAGFSELGFGGGREPGASGLGGRLSLDERGGRGQLQSRALSLNLPRQFAEPIRFERATAAFSWSREGQGWRLRAPSLGWRLLGSEGKAELDLSLPPADESPRLKLQASLKAEDAARLKPLMPLHWGKPLRDWLNRGLVQARISEAQLLIDGPLADFPFHRRPTGRWDLRLALADARLDYQKDWPGIEALRAEVQFSGNGLRFEAESGRSSGVSLSGVTGHIADFARSPLVIDGLTRGETAAYYAFLRASPLAGRLAGLLGHTEAEGPAEAELHLEIPLHSNLGQRTVAAGTVRLPGNTLYVKSLDEPVRDIAGSLRFGDGRGVEAEGLRGRFYDSPVQARIAVNAEGSDELQAQFAADLQAPRGVARRYIPAWLREPLSGSADWTLRLPLGGPRSGQVTLGSDLRGLRSRLPMPLAKTAAESLPIEIGLSGSESVPLQLRLDAPGRLGLALRFGRERGELVVRGLGLRLGGGAVLAPEGGGLAVGGRADQLELFPWLALLGSGEGADLALREAEIEVAHLRAAGYELPSSRLRASRSEAGVWRILLDGEGGEGQIDWSRGAAGDAGQLRGRFTRLALLPLPAEPKAAPAPDDPVVPPIHPARLPVLDLEVQGLRVGGENFGQLRLRSERLAGGQRLRQLELRDGVATLSGGGEWLRAAAGSSAQASFQLGSPDIAAALRGLGFAPTLSGREARFDADLRWASAPTGLDWQQAQGRIRLVASDGAVRGVEPGGTSRVLGLLNFYALPKRLTLNFRDVVAKGLNFDRIEGEFRLAAGDARTDKLLIRSPSLRIELAGRVGLAARDYDQRVSVYPDVSGVTLGALLLGGASLAAGPALPLLALVANQVLDKPLDEVTQLDYRLTGSWDNPEIRKLEAGDRAAPGAQPGEGG